MKLEEITAEIRPRTQWESIDLGVALTRRHFPKLALLWMLTVFPIWALIIFLLRNHPFLALLSIVFLLPLYERPLVYYLSRALFNAPPPISEVLRRYFKIIRPGLIYSLTIARFSPMRTLLTPLFVLEGAKGKQYRSRRTAIVRNGGGSATYLLFICVLIELILLLGVIFLIMSFLPQSVSQDISEWYETLVASLEDENNYRFVVPQFFLWFLVGAALIAISFTELFFVGCGFALYLNSRSHVEGWDIEITFRRLAAKFAPSKTVLTVCLLGTMLFFADLGTAQGNETVQGEIAEILADDDFTVHSQEEKYYSADESGFNAGPLALFGQFLFFALLAAAIFGIAYLIYLNRHLFAGIKRAPIEKASNRTRTVMGMDVASDTLPDDIPAAALAAWRGGDPQLATSLLYRGSICWLVEVANLPLIDSDTENDCLVHSSGLGDAGRHDYFTKLTSQWIRTAYNESAPSESEIERLCSNWPFHSKEVKA
ncbi:MAG: hypothetical protein ACI9NC_004212 [Verrucomicrobiales bacterium]|jgi:hypothetical protein